MIKCLIDLPSRVVGRAFRAEALGERHRDLDLKPLVTAVTPFYAPWLGF
jgi:hypothetical protein